MAMRKVGSRQIIVDGQEFRWRIQRTPTHYEQALGWHVMTFAIQHADGKGALLIVKCAGARPDNWLRSPSTVVTPGRVAKLIQQAMAAGWKPLQAGPPFVIDEKLNEYRKGGGEPVVPPDGPATTAN